MIPNPRGNSRGEALPERPLEGWRVWKRFPHCTIECWRDPGSRPLQRQKYAFMVPNPRENSREGRASRETRGRLADVETISLRIVSVRLHTGETSGRSVVQRQKNALMVPNPRENSRGRRASRETSGRLADVGDISPRIAFVRSNNGETSDSRPLQRQNNALMVPNPRENSLGGRASRETSGRLADVEIISPRIVSV